MASRRLVLLHVLMITFTLLGGARKGFCKPDWLIERVTDQVILTQLDESTLLFTNGLISRTFKTSPNFATISYRSEYSDLSILRSVRPESYVTLDGTQYSIGGLVLQGVTGAYLNRSNFNPQPVQGHSFQYTGHSQSAPMAPFHWEPGLRHSPTDGKWPPDGIHLKVDFKPPTDVARPTHADVTVSVHYELYQGVPILSKWISVQYSGQTPVALDGTTIEYLSVQKPYVPWDYGAPVTSPWGRGTGITSSWLYVEPTVYHGSLVQWTTNPDASVSYGADEPDLQCSYTDSGLGVYMSSDTGTPGYLSEVVTFRCIELVTDSSDKERVALSRHRLTRLLTPQTQENPIFFHATNTTSAGFRVAIDQMVNVGFEMFIYSFGTSFHMEDTSDSNIQEIANNIAYAKSKGIEVGGYDLICLERGHGGYGGNVGDQWDALDPVTKKPLLNACFASGWYDKIHDIMIGLINKTGLSMVETDGPYGGGACAAESHAHHHSLNDSIYWQNRLQGELYKELKQLKVFINSPDLYFHQGSNKDGMGYNEDQYNLPRWEDITISRQGMYDDTYHFIPTQGWMFVPLVQYHGGGAPATFEPLSQHLKEYEWALAQYFGYGVAPCYRGYELYDSPESEALVKKWVAFFNQYRDILISDIVHVRRPDMQDVDAILHVNAFIENRGLAIVFNPTSFSIKRNLTLPLYYTGIVSKADVHVEGNSTPITYTLSRDYSISVSLDMQPQSITWMLIRDSAQ